MNPKKTDEYYHNKNNIDEIYSTASTEHYIGKRNLNLLFVK